MSELNGVLVAIDMATRLRDDAGKMLADIQRRCDGAQSQMDQLDSYAAETESRWSVSAQVSASTEIVRHYYLFMERLRNAIELQRVAVSDLDRQRTLARKSLLDAEVRVAGLNKVLAKRRSAMARVQAGREQRQSDEVAAMQHRRVLAELNNLELP